MDLAIMSGNAYQIFYIAISGTILTFFYLKMFLKSFTEVYYGSQSKLRKKEPPVLYSARFSLTSFLSFSLMFLALAVKYFTLAAFAIGILTKAINIENINTVAMFPKVFDKIALILCTIFIWSGVVFFIRQLVLKNTSFLKNKYCIIESLGSAFLILLLGMSIGSTSNFRAAAVNGEPEALVINITLVVFTFGILGLIGLSLIIGRKLDANFYTEINSINVRSEISIKKNNLHTLRIIARNLGALQIYIISGLAIVIITYLPHVFNTGSFLLLFHISYSLLVWYIVTRMKTVCVPAMTQTKLEE